MTNYKEILRLARSGGFSQREVASILHISVKTIAETVDPTAGHHVETDDESSFFLTHADGREVR